MGTSFSLTWTLRQTVSLSILYFQDMKQFEGDRLISIQFTAKKSLISSLLPVLPVLLPVLPS
jgi:hypothetical protein